jgi:hypothetical protein
MRGILGTIRGILVCVCKKKSVSDLRVVCGLGHIRDMVETGMLGTY